MAPCAPPGRRLPPSATCAASTPARLCALRLTRRLWPPRLRPNLCTQTMGARCTRLQPHMKRAHSSCARRRNPRATGLAMVTIRCGARSLIPFVRYDISHLPRACCCARSHRHHYHSLRPSPPQLPLTTTTTTTTNTHHTTHHSPLTTITATFLIPTKTPLQVCCDGVLHDYNASKRCCGTSYLASSSPSDVCCATSFHSRQADHQCCGSSYAQMTAPANR